MEIVIIYRFWSEESLLYTAAVLGSNKNIQSSLDIACVHYRQDFARYKIIFCAWSLIQIRAI